MPGCSSVRCIPTARRCRRDILGADVTYKLGMPGRHLAMNSLAVLAAAALAGADLALAALSLAQLRAGGRPRRRACTLETRERARRC